MATRSRRPLRGETQEGLLLPGVRLRLFDREHERTLSLISFVLPLLITENSLLSSDRVDFEHGSCRRWDTDFDLIGIPEDAEGTSGTSGFSFVCCETLRMRLLGLVECSSFSATAWCLHLSVGTDSCLIVLLSRLLETLRPRLLLGLACTAAVPPIAR
jgi:hypothetical protein